MGTADGFWGRKNSFCKGVAPSKSTTLQYKAHTQKNMDSIITVDGVTIFNLKKIKVRRGLEIWLSRRILVWHAQGPSNPQYP